MKLFLYPRKELAFQVIYNFSVITDVIGVFVQHFKSGAEAFILVHKEGKRWKIDADIKQTYPYECTILLDELNTITHFEDAETLS